MGSKKKLRKRQQQAAAKAADTSTTAAQTTAVDYGPRRLSYMYRYIHHLCRLFREQISNSGPGFVTMPYYRISSGNNRFYTSEGCNDQRCS